MPGKFKEPPQEPTWRHTSHSKPTSEGRVHQRADALRSNREGSIAKRFVRLLRARARCHSPPRPSPRRGVGARGATAVVAPLNVEGAPEAPARVWAMLP